MERVAIAIPILAPLGVEPQVPVVQTGVVILATIPTIVECAAPAAQRGPPSVSMERVSPYLVRWPKVPVPHVSAVGMHAAIRTKPVALGNGATSQWRR
jgi:hypothetical protein